MGRACSTPGRYKKCVQNFGWKNLREETTWKTQAKMGGLPHGVSYKGY